MFQVSHDSLVPHNHTNQTNSSVSSYYDEDDGYNFTYYLTVYAVLAVINTIFTLYRAFLFACGGIHAAKTIHNHILNSVIKVNNIPFIFK